MKKVYIFLSGMFLFGQLLYGQQHIHWGSTGDPKNGLTITWQSTGESDQIKWGYTTSYELGTFSGIRRNDYSGYLYNYTFPAVNASSIIHYSIFSNDLWTPDKTFQTSVDPTSTKFSFITGGDCRTNLSAWETASNKVNADSADFILFLGDLVESGSSTLDWNNWYSRGANFLENNLIYHTAGNHEYGSIYLNQFVLPGNKEWYSFEFGNILFICLLTQNISSSQHTWLLNELSTTTKKWKVIFFHKPFFTTGSHVNDMNSYRSTWWKAFDDYGVDVVLNGHTHYYLRSKPINLNVSSSYAVAEYGSKAGQGRLQVISGSLGVGPSGLSGSAWYIEKNLSTMSYTKFLINDDILKMITYNTSGTLIDSVTINNKTTTGISDLVTEPVSGFKLNQNYPSPFNLSTTLMYHLATPYYIVLKIHDIKGQEVETLDQGFQSAGDHQIIWQPNELRSGIYFYRLEAVSPAAGSVKSISETKKLILLK